MAFFGRQLRFSPGQDSGNKIPIAKDPPIPELKISPSRSHPGLASYHETANNSATGQFRSLPLIDAIGDKFPIPPQGVFSYPFVSQKIQ